MNEISCPKCGTSFKIDEAGYAEIVRQVRDEAFEKALHERLELAEQAQRAAVELAEATVRNQLKDEAAEKDREIENLRAKLGAADMAKELELSLAQFMISSAKHSAQDLMFLKELFLAP